MATINLGSIKFNWKGSYSGATAYVVDDVVESSGSSYICIAATTGNAPPNATYWEQMSSAGTNGTDLTTTLTTQGDIVYRDASGLARLGAGTAGQALITNGTGANPSWGDVSGGIVQSVSATFTSQETLTSTSFVASSITASITPTSASNKILVMVSGTAYVDNSAQQGFLTVLRNGSTNIAGSGKNINNYYDSANEIIAPIAIMYLDSPNTTSSTSYTVYGKASSGSIRVTTQDAISHIILMEVAV